MTVAEYDEKIKKITQWETFCVIPVVVVNVLPHRPADESRALLSLLFRVGVFLLSIFAVIMFEVWKFLLRRERKALLSAAPPVDEVRYPRSGT